MLGNAKVMTIINKGVSIKILSDNLDSDFMVELIEDIIDYTPVSRRRFRTPRKPVQVMTIVDTGIDTKIMCYYENGYTTSKLSKSGVLFLNLALRYVKKNFDIDERVR